MKMIAAGAMSLLEKKSNTKNPLISWQLVKIYNCLKWPKTFTQYCLCVYDIFFTSVSTHKHILIFIYTSNFMHTYIVYTFGIISINIMYIVLFLILHISYTYCFFILYFYVLSTCHHYVCVCVYIYIYIYIYNIFFTILTLQYLYSFNFTYTHIHTFFILILLASYIHGHSGIYPFNIFVFHCAAIYSPHVLIAEEEKIIIDDVDGDNLIFKEK